MISPQERIRQIDERLDELPKGTLTYKNIHGKKRPYLQRTVQGKSVSTCIKKGEQDTILMELFERADLLEERKRLEAYVEQLREILSANPYLGERACMGYQSFEFYGGGQQFYVDKTYFIPEWMAAPAQVTLITRPRRFGKTLLLSTIEHFFDPGRGGHEDWFEKLKVWRNAKCRALYGKIPVISINFSAVKGQSFDRALRLMANSLSDTYAAHAYIFRNSARISEDRDDFHESYELFTLIKRSLEREESDYLPTAVKTLAKILYDYYGVKPILLLDEYDTPIQEAYVGGYADEMLDLCRLFFNASFKQNPYYQKALILGIMKISQNSLFSDMNHTRVVTCLSDPYGDVFGFTEQEVMDILKCRNIDEMQEIKRFYDGFIFGKTKDIYNPWSISCFLVEGKYLPYWANTSSNELIGQLIGKASPGFKMEMESQIRGESLHKRVEEDTSLLYLDGDENAVWSLLLATGYLKAEYVEKKPSGTECELSITNQETFVIFYTQILKMFSRNEGSYDAFVQALLHHQTDELNQIINDITYSSLSYFDSGHTPANRSPENFYHGLVLGLIVSLRDRYRITSNRESGRGRYDIAMVPLALQNGKEGEARDAFIIEFKVKDPKKEASLQATLDTAFAQISQKRYDTELLASGVPKERIFKLAFAFEGKDVLVEERQ